MINQLRKYIQNKKTIEGKERQILGSDTTLKAFASFWEQYGDELMMVTAVKLHDWEHESVFEKSELLAYREGLATLGIFFKDCWQVVEKQQQELENKKDSK